MHDAKIDAVEIDDLVFLVIHFGRSVEQFGARRAKVGASRRRGVITVPGGGWPWMNIFGLCECLSYETRAYSLSVNSDQAAVRLPRENQLGHTGHHGRIEQSGKNRENQRQTKSRSKFFKHALLLYARCIATIILSISHMPGNGTMIPPRP